MNSTYIEYSVFESFKQNMRRHDCRRNKPITVGARHPFKVNRKLDLNLYM